ncbi:DUF1090 domain-containing protein [Serratia symbiotica]|nr:DUF1090 domain-containing protein [Serratia symbiotica]
MPFTITGSLAMYTTSVVVCARRRQCQQGAEHDYATQHGNIHCVTGLKKALS